LVWGLGASEARANIPCVPEESFAAAANPGTILVVPDGTGESLAEVGSTITVSLIDCGNVPIPNFPWQDIWVDDYSGSDLALCQGGSYADHNTDSQGMTTISGRIAGGGFSEGPLGVYVAGSLIYTSQLDIRVVSPDINGDLQVNLADVSDFAVDFASPAGAPRSDMNHDGAVNLADVGVFAAHLGASCP